MIAVERETRKAESWGPDALAEVREARRQHQERTTPDRGKWIQANHYDYDQMKRLLRFIIEPQKRVLDVRCETGHLLASVDPAEGVGVEISDAMVESAKRENPNLHFVRSDPETLDLETAFDYVIFYHIFDTVDILAAFERIRRHCHADTRVIIINYNHLWQPLLGLASRLGLRSRFVEP